MKLKKIIPATVLTLAMTVSFGGVAFAGGRTSDEVIRKQYSHPTGYDPSGQKRDKYSMYEANAAAMGLESSDSSYEMSVKPSADSTTNVASNKGTNSLESATTQKVQQGLSFSGEDYTLQYVRHEISTDYNGNKCLLYYYNFTNTGNDSMSSTGKAWLTFYQNGIECDSTYLSGTNKSVSNSWKSIMPGATIEICDVNLISDMSDVTVEAKEYFKSSDNKSTQVLHLK